MLDPSNHADLTFPGEVCNGVQSRGTRKQAPEGKESLQLASEDGKESLQEDNSRLNTGNSCVTRSVTRVTTCASRACRPFITER